MLMCLHGYFRILLRERDAARTFRVLGLSARDRDGDSWRLGRGWGWADLIGGGSPRYLTEH